MFNQVAILYIRITAIKINCLSVSHCMNTLCPCTWVFVMSSSTQLYCIVHIIIFSIVIAIILSAEPPFQACKGGIHMDALLPVNERKCF